MKEIKLVRNLALVVLFLTWQPANAAARGECEDVDNWTCNSINYGGCCVEETSQGCEFAICPGEWVLCCS